MTLDVSDMFEKMLCWLLKSLAASNRCYSSGPSGLIMIE